MTSQQGELIGSASNSRALWSPAGKWLNIWLSFVMLNSVFVTFPCGILGQVSYLIVSIPDLCPFLLYCTKQYALSSILFMILLENIVVRQR